MSASLLPITMVLSVGGLILFCRPYLEAARPVASLALVAGAILGPSITGLVPQEALAGLQPLYHLSAGWLVLGAALSWDLGSLRRLGAMRFLPRLILASAFPAVVAILWPAVIGASLGSLLGPFLLCAVIAVCLDPTASRAALLSSSRPDLAIRRAPGLATLALGSALAASALVPAAPRSSVAGLMIDAGWAVLLGAGLGMLLVALMRLAQGKALLLALLLSAALLGQGLAARFGLAPLAVLFVAGVILANDGARREMLGVILQELERPFMVTLLLLAGASLPLDAPHHGVVLLAGATAGFVLARHVIWILIGQAGPGSAALPFSPLVLALALTAGGLPGWWGTIPMLAGVSFIVSEAAWLWLKPR